MIFIILRLIKNSNNVLLNNDISVSNNIILTSGNLDGNGHQITLGSTGNLSETAGNTFKNGIITTTRTIDAPSSLNVGGLGAEISTSANLGSTTVSRGHTEQTANSSNSVLRYFDISPTNNTGLNATLVFHYDDSELNSLNESSLVLFSSTNNGTSWTNNGGTINTSTNTVTKTGLDHFSRWTLAASNGSLPVEINSFAVKAKSSGQILLNWQTVSEVNNYGFYIEKFQSMKSSTDMRENSNNNWGQIGFIKGNGNSSSIKNYSFIDNHVSGAGYFYYRLKQVDLDGNSQYSKIVEIKAVPAEFTLYQNYPNPFNPTTSIRYDIPHETMVKLLIYDALGNIVKTLVNKTKTAGSYVAHFNAENIPSGIYFYQLITEGKISTKKLILVK